MVRNLLTSALVSIAIASASMACSSDDSAAQDPGDNMISASYGGISTLVPSPALDGNPNIILLHIGTNDLFARDTANMPARPRRCSTRSHRTRRARSSCSRGSPPVIP